MLTTFNVETNPETRRERPKSAPYLRLKNIQGTNIGKIWKNDFFFKKKYFLKKVAQCRKLKKGPFRLIKRFYKPKTQRGDPLVSPLFLEA